MEMKNQLAFLVTAQNHKGGSPHCFPSLLNMQFVSAQSSAFQLEIHGFFHGVSPEGELAPFGVTWEMLITAQSLFVNRRRSCVQDGFLAGVRSAGTSSPERSLSAFPFSFLPSQLALLQLQWLHFSQTKLLL